MNDFLLPGSVCSGAGGAGLLHEWHHLVARIAGVKVLRDSVGFRACAMVAAGRT